MRFWATQVWSHTFSPVLLLLVQRSTGQSLFQKIPSYCRSCAQLLFYIAVGKGCVSPFIQTGGCPLQSDGISMIQTWWETQQAPASDWHHRTTVPLGSWQAYHTGKKLFLSFLVSNCHFYTLSGNLRSGQQFGPYKQLHFFISTLNTCVHGHITVWHSMLSHPSPFAFSTLWKQNKDRSYVYLPMPSPSPMLSTRKVSNS